VSSKYWLQRAERVRAANRAVNAAADNRRLGPSGRWDRAHPSFTEWEHAVEVFWAAMRATYPAEFWENYERLKSGDALAADYAIDFLEADPICDRSGYLKADLLRFLGRAPLNREQAERLRAVVVSVTIRRYGREFRRYCELARRLDEPSFRERLAHLLKSDDPDVRRRASWVLQALLRKGS
jgi:hypothetical protein